jgi:hypothetical protein
VLDIPNENYDDISACLQSSVQPMPRPVQLEQHYSLPLSCSILSDSLRSEELGVVVVVIVLVVGVLSLKIVLRFVVNDGQTNKLKDRQT